MKMGKLFNSCKILTSVVLLWTSVCGCIQLKKVEEDKRLSTTTIQLLSLFKHCIIFTVNWAYDSGEPLTPTNYFIFYSESISCALVVSTYTQYHDLIGENLRLEKFEPRPLFTKYITTLINLYSPAPTDGNEKPTIDYFPTAIRKYNIPFNYVLLFMSKRKFPTAQMTAMLSECLWVSAPAVYIVVLDDQEVSIVGFAHVLQRVPYLFKVTKLQVSHIQLLHENIHKDFQGSQIQVLTKIAPPLCEYGASTLGRPNDCVLSTLMTKYNLSYCNPRVSSCALFSISTMIVYQQLMFHEAFIRRYAINLEFINYIVDDWEHSFICIVETGQMGFIAFMQAFDLSTWILAAAVCSFLTLTIAAMSNKKVTSWLTKLQASAVVVVMLLFDRFYEHHSLQRAASRQSTFVLALWAFGAMLLGMSYSGKIVSQLTAPSLPPLPRDMHELTVVNYKIFTTNELFFSNLSVGYIHHEINEYLKTNGHTNGTLINDLQQLSTAVTFVNDSSLPEHQTNSSGMNSKVLFAIVDKDVAVKGFGLRYVLTSGSLRALPGGTLPFFNERLQIAVLSNSLFPIFRNFFAQISEPGIWQFWQNSYTAKAVQYFSVSGNNKTTLSQSSLSRTNLASIWQNYGPVFDGDTSWNPIAMNSMDATFQVFGICLFVSAMVLLYERRPWRQVVIHHKVQTRMTDLLVIGTRQILQSFKRLVDGAGG